MIVFSSPQRLIPRDFHEIWDYQKFITLFRVRDVKHRYNQTGYIIAWAILQPILTMALFSLIFGRLANIPSDNNPCPFFILIATVPWTFCAERLTQFSPFIMMSMYIMIDIYYSWISEITSPCIHMSGIHYVEKMEQYYADII
ncbi:MAG: hypothetical protein QHH06_15785 [Clostridiales bacterium]|jgi:lipopolysaccharide transport system permease protein|nr:hypothetical protein [Clostridiales bacterium]